MGMRMVISRFSVATPSYWSRAISRPSNKPKRPTGAIDHKLAPDRPLTRATSSHALRLTVSVAARYAAAKDHAEEAHGGARVARRVLLKSSEVNAMPTSTWFSRSCDRHSLLAAALGAVALGVGCGS